jgi:hypothetical protein
MGLVSKNLVVRNTQVRGKFVQFISSQTASGAGSSITTSSLPPNTANGDLMLAVYSSGSYSGPSNWYTPPAGWTEILDYESPISGISYKTAVVPGDAGFTWSGAGGSTTRFLQLSFRQSPAAPLSVDVIGTRSNVAANNGTITIPSITTTVDNSIVLAIIISGEAWNRPVQPTGYTLIAERLSAQTDASRASVFVYTRDQAVAGATGAVTTNFSDNTGGHYGILISLRPT